MGTGEDFVLAGTHLSPPSSCLQYSWFFFEILVKSMALYLLDENKIKVRAEAHSGEAFTDKPRGSCGNARSLSRTSHLVLSASQATEVPRVLRSCTAFFAALHHSTREHSLQRNPRRVKECQLLLGQPLEGWCRLGMA